MIAKETYTIDYVNTLREKYKKDPSPTTVFTVASVAVSSRRTRRSWTN